MTRDETMHDEPRRETLASTLQPRVGAHVVAGGTRFRVPAAAEAVAVVLVGRDGSRDVRPLARVRAGWHEAVLGGVEAGARYLLRVGDREVPDPFARSLPEGPHAPAEVLDPIAVTRARRPISIERAPVVYELHVGTFTPEGTFEAARARLPHLVELGIDAIELMPVATFPGRRGWGYDGVAPLAPFAGYGRPAELALLVDEAHRLGLSVLLDVVLNHFGPDGNWLPAIDPSLFDDEIATPWGPAPSFAHGTMRALAREVLRLWVVEYGFDGLRLDATHAIVDRSEPHVLAELAALARTLPGPPVLIAEDDRNDPRVVTELGLDAVWADDFHHAVHALLTGEQDGYYRAFPPELATVADTLRRGWLYEGQRSAASGVPRGRPLGDLARARLFYCLENHDQIGNRARGERLAHLVPEEDARAATLLLAFSPSSILLFQGQEWGASAPFLYFTDHEPSLGAKITEGRRSELSAFAAFASGGSGVPDPQDESTFLRSVLDWDERGRAPHAGILALHRAALALRRADPVLSAGRGDLEVARHGDLLVVIRSAAGERRTLVWNVGRSPHELGSMRGALLLGSSETALRDATLAPRSAAIVAGSVGPAP